MLFILENMDGTIRNPKEISDVQFVNICNSFIGAESSLKSLVLDHSKNYLLIDNE